VIVTDAELAADAVNQARRDGVHQIMDYLVIGAGPAGPQLGYFLQRSGHDYLVLEAGSTPGTFFRTFPRHRSLISINKPNTGKSTPDAICEWTGTRCSPTIPDCCSPS
jgi:Pyridine nucleotide-disulphide oxidoreductase